MKLQEIEQITTAAKASGDIHSAICDFLGCSLEFKAAGNKVPPGMDGSVYNIRHEVEQWNNADAETQAGITAYKAAGNKDTHNDAAAAATAEAVDAQTNKENTNMTDEERAKLQAIAAELDAAVANAPATTAQDPAGTPDQTPPEVAPPEPVTPVPTDVPAATPTDTTTAPTDTTPPVVPTDTAAPPTDVPVTPPTDTTTTPADVPATTPADTAPATDGTSPIERRVTIRRKADQGLG